jgi:Na+/H+ antiporter NhaD/arsenite permease-like protein
MFTASILVFIAIYACIACEHPLRINKSSFALIAAGIMWTLYAFSGADVHLVSEQLGEKLAETAGIVFFLIGAMTIVEVIDANGGFDILTSKIRSKKARRLLITISILSFFLSAVLDNMTTAIVMVTLIRGLAADRSQRFLFSGMIVIAANAGGAWSPIGDVTTTMLWIGGQVTTTKIITGLFLPSLVNLLIPLAIASFFCKGNVVTPERPVRRGDTTEFEKRFILGFGLTLLLFVPAFKSITHLPPYMGILLSLGILWLASEILNRDSSDARKESFSLAKALKRIDMASVLFFIGILLSVGALSSNGALPALSRWLTSAVGNESAIVLITGIASSVVDNIPLVAAAMGMFPLSQFPADSFLWEFLAYCAGTGGSLLIIGSAAGVAAMGIEKIEFFDYMKKISPLALAGYFGGAAVYIIQHMMTT